MTIVDFSHVPSNQTEIHDRLENWAKWCRGSGSRNVHPMFRHYRDNYWEDKPAPTYLNTLDAAEIQKTMAHIPERNRIAVQWCYVQRSNPPRVCLALGVSKAALLGLITEGRTMVENRLRQGAVKTIYNASGSCIMAQT